MTGKEELRQTSHDDFRKELLKALAIPSEEIKGYTPDEEREIILKETRVWLEFLTSLEELFFNVNAEILPTSDRMNFLLQALERFEEETLEEKLDELLNQTIPNPVIRTIIEDFLGIPSLVELSGRDLMRLEQSISKATGEKFSYGGLFNPNEGRLL